MNWFITGGCGFIGAALVKRLLAHGDHNIRVLDNLSVGSRMDLPMANEFRELRGKELDGQKHPLELVVGDIRDEELASRASHGFDIIVHLAANAGVGPSVENPRADMSANVIGTFNYLEAARINQIQRFVFASSSAPIGDIIPPVHEEMPLHPVSPYGASKLAGEGYCSAYKRSFGIDTVALRFGNVYGPGSAHKSSIVAKFLRQALAGETFAIYGDGLQTRDFIYISDLVDAILLSATTENVGGEVFQIASNCETTIEEIASHLVAILHGKGVHGIKVAHSEPRIGDIRRNFSDTAKARKMLGWQARVSLEDGLMETVSYFLTQRASQ